MRSASEAGAMWYELKQSIENGFELAFKFRFKKCLESLKSYNKKFLASKYSGYSQQEGKKAKRESSESKNTFCLVIQNSKEISNWKSTRAPTKLSEIPEYFTIKLSLEEKLTPINEYKSERECRSRLSIFYNSKNNPHRKAKLKGKSRGL